MSQEENSINTATPQANSPDSAYFGPETLSGNLNVSTESTHEIQSQTRNLLRAAVFSIFLHGSLTLSAIDGKTERWHEMTDNISSSISSVERFAERKLHELFHDKDTYSNYEAAVNGQKTDVKEDFATPRDFIVDKYKTILESRETLDIGRFFLDAEWASGGVNEKEIADAYKKLVTTRDQIKEKNLEGMELLQEIAKAFKQDKHYQEQSSFVADFFNQGSYNCETAVKIAISLTPERSQGYNMALQLYGEHIRLLYRVDQEWYVFDQGNIAAIKPSELNNTLIMPYDAFVKQYLGLPFEKRLIARDKVVPPKSNPSTNSFYNLAPEFQEQLTGFNQETKPHAGNNELGNEQFQSPGKPMQVSIIYKTDLDHPKKQTPEYTLPENRLIEAEISGELHLYGSEVNNLNFLKDLKGIKNVIIDGIGTNNLDPLADLKGLERLSLSSPGSEKFDLNFLKNISGLKRLLINTEEVKDFAPISTLTSLEEFHISSRHGSLHFNDLSFLSGLNKLKILELWGIVVDNFDAIRSMSELKDFKFYSEGGRDSKNGNKPETLTTIDFLQPLKKLEEISIGTYSGQNLDALLGSKDTIKEIFIDHGENPVNMDALSQLTHLDRLYLDTPAKDLSALSGLRAIKMLHLTTPNAKDLSFIRNLKTLEYLEIREMGAADIEFLRDFRGTNLEDISLPMNVKLKDLGPLRQLAETLGNLSITIEPQNLTELEDAKNLRSLTIGGHLKNYSVISKLPKLETLTILDSYTANKDLSPLRDLLIRGLMITTYESHYVDCKKLRLISDTKPKEHTLYQSHCRPE